MILFKHISFTKEKKPVRSNQEIGFARSVLFQKFSHHPPTRNTFSFAPVPLIWISNTNKSHLFGFVWASPCCERKVGGTGQRILELLSENIDGMEPVPVSLQPKTHVNVLQVGLQLGNIFFSLIYFYLFRRKADWAWSTRSLSALHSILLAFFFHWQHGGGGQPKLPTGPKNCSHLNCWGWRAKLNATPIGLFFIHIISSWSFVSLLKALTQLPVVACLQDYCNAIGGSALFYCLAV